MPSEQQPGTAAGAVSADDAPYTDDELLRIFSGAVSMENLGKILGLDPPLSPIAEEREATVFFSDIRGATDLIERLGTEPARRLVNDTLLAVTVEAVQRGGYVDKYIGDMAMIVFGAPLASTPTEQALAAADLGLAVYKAAAGLGVDIGVGINTGNTALGCMTPRNRPSYSALGDAVNRAARMEGHAKLTGGRPAVTKRVHELIASEYRTAFVSEVRLNRFPDLVQIYAVVARKVDLTSEETRFWDRYDQATGLVAAGRPAEALTTLMDLIAERTDDALLQTAANRARKRYAEALSSTFAAAPGIGELASEVCSALSTIFDVSAIGLLECGGDGVWRFREGDGFSTHAVVMAPTGEAIVWMKGLERAVPVASGPDVVRRFGFTHVAPFRKDNELAGVLFIAVADDVDYDALSTLAEVFADPWSARSGEEMRLRFQEKIDDAEKLEEVIRELESKSIALERSLEENRGLNHTLEQRVEEHAARLERASTLKRYLPASVVDEIIDGRRDLSPRTERRKLTILFSDVHGFTEATDGLEPEELARLLNNYLSSMSSIAFKAGATIDKFRGDGMMVFFGAPKPMDPATAARACLDMAINMCREVDRLRTVWFEEGYDWDLGVRIGINTGFATVGEFGSADRLDYTAIGTEVNLASRLETACDTNTILISHSTWALVRDAYACEAIGPLEVKGIHRKVRAYRVLWPADDASDRI